MTSIKKTITALLLSVILLLACGQGATSEKETVSKNAQPTSPTMEAKLDRKVSAAPPFKTDAYGKTIESRFKVPVGYKRSPVENPSFAAYLRRLPLKPEGARVTYFNGEIKPNRNVYDAVVDLPIGKRDLHQCADAVMRLRAEYLFENEKYDSIHFNFTNGFRADYSKWRKGQRISVSGNDVRWRPGGTVSDSYGDFWKYLEMVFSYAGTASLEKELPSVSIDKLAIGDIFIKGGFPGHAVIVVDLAIHPSTKEKVFLLAQSYMPAQEIQILKNPNNSDLSPWYSLSQVDDDLRTPEWTFGKGDLKRF